MSRRYTGADLRPSHSWVWTADAERRWLRAFRLLLSPEEPGPGVQREEGDDAHDCGGVCTGLDGAAGRAADD